MSSAYAVELHPIQASAPPLLDRLYRDLHLPPTEAIRAVLDRQTPTVESILATLALYDKETVVAEFLEANADDVASARAFAKERERERYEREALWESQARERAAQQAETGQWLTKPRKRPTTWTTVKSVSLQEIEKAIATALSTLTGSTLKVSVTRCVVGEHGHEENVEVQLELAADRLASAESAAEDA